MWTEGQQQDQQPEHQQRRPCSVEQVVAERGEHANQHAAGECAAEVADSAEHRGGHRGQPAAQTELGIGRAEVGGEDGGAEAGQRAGRGEREQLASGGVAAAQRRHFRILLHRPQQASGAAARQERRAAERCQRRDGQHNEVFERDGTAAHPEVNRRDQVGHRQQGHADALVHVGGAT